MGNCCGRESGNFSGEGRTLGSTPANAPPQPDRATKPKISSSGQKLGNKSQTAEESLDAREAARQAATERYEASNAPGGKLQNQLNKDKNKTLGQTLVQNANENLAHRNMDASHERQAYT